MLLTILEFLWWLQPAASSGGGGGGGGGGGAGAAGGLGGNACAMNAGLFALVMVFFYFFLIRPEQKRRKEHEEMLAAITKGSEVRTTGGILGTVVTVADDHVILQIADKTRVNVLRSNIQTVESSRKADAAGGGKAKDDKDGSKEEARD